MVNTAKNLLIMLKNVQQMHLKLLQKESFKKKAKTMSDLIGNKITDVVAKLYNRKFQKIRSKIIQRQLQIRIIKKCRNIFISRRKARNY